VRPGPDLSCDWTSRLDQGRRVPAIAVNQEGRSSMKLKSIAGLFAALLFAFAAIGCSSSSSTPAPAAGSPAAAAASPAA